MNKQGLTAFFLFSAFFFIYSNILDSEKLHDSIKPHHP